VPRDPHPAILYQGLLLSRLTRRSPRAPGSSHSGRAALIVEPAAGLRLRRRLQAGEDACTAAMPAEVMISDAHRPAPAYRP